MCVCGGGCSGIRPVQTGRCVCVRGRGSGIRLVQTGRCVCVCVGRGGLG